MTTKVFIKKRKLVIITGSDSSGKSKLGHILGSNRNSIYSYSTTPYHEYFNKNNFVIYENKIDALKKAVKINFYYQNGGLTKERKKWIKSDKLFYYDFKKINQFLQSKIKKNLSISDFYYYWSEALIEGRKNGKKTSITILEIENLFEQEIVKHFHQSEHEFKIIDIKRNPYEQLKHIKIHMLFRGGNLKKIKGFYGALNGKSNIYKNYLIGIVEQYLNANLNSKNGVLYLTLKNLKPINFNTAKAIAKHIEFNHDKKFIKFLMLASKFDNYSSPYFKFQIKNQTSALSKIQEEFKLEKFINESNIEEHMYGYEKFFYLNICKILLNKKFKINKILWLYFLIFSLIKGFKDIRKNLPFLILIKKRINAFSTVIQIMIKFLKYKRF